MSDEDESPRPNAQVATQGRNGQLVAPANLTQRQADLAELLAAGVRQGLAGRLTGYTAGRGDASRASNSPAVRARVIELQRRALGRLAPLGTRLVADIITGKVDAPAATRLDAVKYVHKAAGLDTPVDKANDNRSLRTLSMAELEAIAIKALEARTADIAPHRPGDDAQPIDIIEESVT